jgi:hypothetical protein
MLENFSRLVLYFSKIVTVNLTTAFNLNSPKHLSLMEAFQNNTITANITSKSMTAIISLPNTISQFKD